MALNLCHKNETYFYAIQIFVGASFLTKKYIVRKPNPKAVITRAPATRE